jgi:sec-independent protein translocase protein TatB
MEGFFGIGFQELVMIAVVALIVLGPERLPATLREVAKFIRQIRNLTNEFTQQFGDDFKALEDLDPRRMLQQAINSIDEEEQAKDGTAKGKTTPAKPAAAATTKTTPAKATTPKTTSSTTAATKPATTKPVVATAGKSTGVPKATTTTPASETVATDSTQAATGTTSTSAPTPPLDSADAPENQHRILPPDVERSVREADAPTSASTPAAQTNGNEIHKAATLDAGLISSEEGSAAAPNTNGNQDHSVA